MMDCIRIFTEVVSQGNFTKAAHSLRIHRPSVSKAIQKLEHKLGIKLLHRTTRQLALTEEGQQFYKRASCLVKDFNLLMEGFHDKDIPEGVIRIDTSLAVTHEIILPAIKGFQRQYPAIEIILTASDKRTNLAAEGVDCVIRLGKLPDSTLISKQLGALQMATCAAPAYIEKEGRPTAPDHLADHKTVGFFMENSHEVMPWHFYNGKEIISIRPRTNLLVDNSDVLLRSGLNGFGIIHGIRAAMQPYILSGQLIELFPPDASPVKDISILWPQKEHLTQRVRVFINFLTKFYKCKFG